ncbi:tetratricopeptide repeat protein, partial [Streptomyces sp. NPDC097619]|uniref:tetratricopeptide repeat protein n=1 Tax=Streptomyces sp. NPDC097619 TaxID=3157228 RepID=UPI0033336709
MRPLSVEADRHGVAAGGNIDGSALGAHSRVDNSRHYHLPAARDKVVWPLRIGDPPLPASAFQPRPALRTEIEAARAAGDTAVLTGTQGSGSTRVLSGGGGVGKTQLAAAYAHEATSQGTDLVLWIAAGDSVQTVTAYAQAALRVRAPGAAGETPEDDARAFLAWLAVTDRSWLIVLDDITDTTALTPWWPPPRPGTGWTLATTRLKDATLTGQGRIRVDVDVYTAEEAHAYLTHRLTTDGYSHLLDSHEENVAEHLGRLPLALGHAAAYLINRQTTCADYLDLLRDRSRRINELLPAGADTEGYGRQVAAALLLSLDAAETADTTGIARHLLHLTALLDPAGQPTTLFTSPPVLQHLAHKAGRADVGAGEVRDALLVLHRYALITYDTRSTHREVRIHALTARAVTEAIPDHHQADLREAAAQGLTELWPEHAHTDRALTQILRNNTETLMDLADSPGQAELHLAFRYGANLGEDGLYGRAVDHWTILVSHLAPDHADAVTARSLLAHTYSQLGRHDQALQVQEEVLADRIRALGPDHPVTHRAQANLAVTYSHLGRHQDALHLKEQVLTDRIRTLGPDHPGTHIAQANLAVTYTDLGRHQEALHLEEQVLTDR